jgi:hypothetical protein
MGTDDSADASQQRHGCSFALHPVYCGASGLCMATRCAQVHSNPGASTALGKAPLSGEQVVDNLLAMNLERAHALHAYQGTRALPVAIPRFCGQSQRGDGRGPKVPITRNERIHDPVFDWVEADYPQSIQEALTGRTGSPRKWRLKSATALNRDNYDFTLVGYDSTPSGSMYVLGVKPRTKGKFLYRGRIWVEAEDFAVTRLEAQPAKNPSFWTKHSEIEEVIHASGGLLAPCAQP